MLIAQSLWRKLLVMLIVVTSLLLVYEVTLPDSRFALGRIVRGDVEPMPQAGSRLRFLATAYCKGTTTASGVNVRSGIAAADPDLLPVGSVIQVDAPGARYDGVYTIMDTGPKVQGRRLDLYIWSCHEALAFGRPHVSVGVLRLGWSPQASSPGIINRLFRRREAAMRNPPPLPPEAERQVPPATLPDPAQTDPSQPADAPAQPDQPDQPAKPADEPTPERSSPPNR